MLGRPFTITGRVQQGAKRGRELGFPTANIGIAPEYEVLAKGVYVVQVEGLSNRAVQGVANFGRRPSVGVQS